MASVSGLVSGLDTATIISQLMQLESGPKTKLASKVTTEQRAISALQTFNAKLASITTQAAELAKTATWGGVSGTSSNDKVGVTTRAGASAGTFDLTVNRLATASVLDLGTHALTDRMTGSNSTVVSLTKPDGTTVAVETGDGTVQGFVDAVNKTPSTGVSASLVKLDDGSYRLRLVSASTGDKAIGVAEEAGKDPLAFTGDLTRGLKASITVGADTITSDANTFTDLVPGVDVTLKSGASGSATVTTGLSTQGVTDKVKALVDAVNAAITETQSLTNYNSATKTAGLLASDPTVRGVASQLLQTFTAGVGGQSLASLGIQSDRTGKLVFDAAKFTAAYAADPTGTAAKFTSVASDSPAGAVAGVAAKLESLAKSFSNSSDGAITEAIKGRTSLVDRLTKDIDSWEARLEVRRSALERQYGALEVALGKLQSQSSWLAGQINSLPTSSSGS